ncbi:DUF6414 family protein [Cellulomonas sp. NPDC055163]
MSGYQKPKNRLHREFIYLNHETVVNSLSALEAGKIDEIIAKVSEAREGGFEAGAGYGPIKASGGKKKTSNVEEELRRTRTWFSAFEAWYTHLTAGEAIGRLVGWDRETRDELEAGDTVQFVARVSMSPIQQVLLTYISFANDAGNADSPFKQPANKIAELKKIARMMSGWLRGRDDAKNVMVYLAPLAVQEPLVAARLEEQYIVGGTQALEGEYTVVAQVEMLIAESGSVPAVRVLRDVPPTPLEITTINNALKGFIEPASGLGVEVDESDLTLSHPGIIVHPIAIFR